MHVKPIQSPIIRAGDDLLSILLAALAEPLRERDLICITSKVVSMAQGRLARLDNTHPERTAADFAALVRQEADVLFTEEGPLFLALKDGIFIANAGVDLSNTPPGTAVLWPHNPWTWAAMLRSQLQAHFSLDEFGIIVTDSQVTPLRRGVTGLALAYAGLEGVETDIGRPDLFGRPLAMTGRAVADGLASSAVLLMGEADERTPFVLIRGAPVRFTERAIAPQETQMDPRQDLFASIYHEKVWSKLRDPGEGA